MRLFTLLTLIIFPLFLNAQTRLCTEDGRTCRAECTFCTTDTSSPGPYRSVSVDVSVPAGQYLQVVDFSCGAGSTIDGNDDLFINGAEYPDGGCFFNDGPNTLLVNISLRVNRSDECITYEVTTSGSGSCNLLPIELNSFDVFAIEDRVKIEWQTALEINNAYMEVERSRDGKNFTAVSDKILGAGTTDEPQNYSFIDKTPLLGVSYYRLKQVDYDGASALHETKIVQRKTLNWEVQAYPSITTAELNLASSSIFMEGTLYKIYNTNGQLLQRGRLDVGTNSETINVLQLPSGQYMIQLQSATDVTTTTFFKK